MLWVAVHVLARGYMAANTTATATADAAGGTDPAYLVRHGGEGAATELPHAGGYHMRNHQALRR